jgi:hypothetical protein
MNRFISAFLLICGGMILGATLFGASAARADDPLRTSYGEYNWNVTPATCSANYAAAFGRLGLTGISSTRSDNANLVAGYFSGGQMATVFCITSADPNITVVLQAVFGTDAGATTALYSQLSKVLQ